MGDKVVLNMRKLLDLDLSLSAPKGAICTYFWVIEWWSFGLVDRASYQPKVSVFDEPGNP